MQAVIVRNYQTEGAVYRNPHKRVLKAAAKLELEDRTVSMAPGDSILIPAHPPHRVLWTTAEEPTVWLAIFSGQG